MSEEAITIHSIADALREAEALIEQKKHAEAVEVLQQGRRSGPLEPAEEAVLHFDLGACYAALRRPNEASPNYRKSAELYESVPDSAGQAQALEHLGTMQHQRRNFRDAEDVYKHALRLYRSLEDRAGQARCHRNLGNVHMDTTDREQALTDYHEARGLFAALQDLDGLAPCVTSAASILYEKQGRPAAVAEYRKALDEEKCEHHLVLNNLGFMLLLDRDLQGAREHLDRALADLEKRGMNADDGGVVHLNLGNVTALQGDLEAAEKLLAKAVAFFDEDPQGRVIEAVLLPNQIFQDQGFEPFLLAEDALKPAVGRLNHAAVRALQGRLDEAVQEAEKALELDRDPSYPYVVLGWIHHLREDKDQASTSFKRAVGKEPNNPQIRQALELVNPFLAQKVGRNDACPCGSGKKFKKCHGAS